MNDPPPVPSGAGADDVGFAWACSALVRALGQAANARPRLPADAPRPQLRAAADRHALRLRYHDAAVHRRLRPAEALRGLCFDALEEARFHALGARHWRGVRHNLQRELQELVRTAWRTGSDGDALRLAQGLFATLCAFLLGDAATAPAAALVRRRMQGDFVFWDDACARMRRQMADQDAYALLARALVQRLDMTGLQPPEQHPENESAQASAEDGEAAGPQQDAPAQAAARQGRRRRPAAAAARVHDYRVFTRASDEVIGAAALLPRAERAAWRRRLDEASRRSPMARRWMHELEKALSIRVVRPWIRQNDEDGSLDPAYLARLVASPLAAIDRFSPGEARLADAAVTLLVDNSASMRGRSIERAAVCVDLLAAALGRAGVTVEILGYTTVFGHDNPCRRQWGEAGAPVRPGRLNAVRHIVYKPAAAAWRVQRANLGVMLEPRLLKENIDGEALDWAYRRLRRRPEARRVLMVLCDGAPDDAATLGSNPPDCLVRHLRHVVACIEAERGVELTAIGIGYDVSRFYPRSITVYDDTVLAQALGSELIRLLGGEGGSPMR